ncbi:MAG: S-adenosylmethionine:tRNA ribosyltransferase-isomerase, partial [Acidimicrobiales bacterium]
PRALEAGEPPEARGLARDGVKMMVGRRSTGTLVHTKFVRLPSFLEAGDLVVVNTSGTIPAAVDGIGVTDHTPVVVHLSTHLDGELWVVEPRLPSGGTTQQWNGGGGRWPPRHITLAAGGGHLELLEPYLGRGRLWLGRLAVPRPALDWLAVHGRPIRYSYVDRPWPLADYQNVYATEPGSAEMPSAGRPFTAEVLGRLADKGVGVAPIVLHAGVASLEPGEAVFPERVTVSEATAALVNATRRAGNRVIAVGTTVVRAVESAVDPATGRLGPLDGWTDLFITAERGVQVVDGLLTGWHEPGASHLEILEAVAGSDLVTRSYAASLEAGYLFHEFGDVHLLLA